MQSFMSHIWNESCHLYKTHAGGEDLIMPAACSTPRSRRRSDLNLDLQIT